MANIYTFAGPHTVWSSQKQEELYEHSAGSQLFGWAGLGVVASGMFAAGMANWGGEKGFTKAYRALQVGERFALPGGIMATFRAPSLVSPWVEHERIVEATGSLFSPIFPAETLRSSSGSNPFTSKVFATLFGVEEHQLISLGRQGFRFERHTPTSSTGRIIDVATGNIVQEQARLMQRGRARELSRMIQAVIATRNPDLLEQLQGYYENQQYGTNISRSVSRAEAIKYVTKAGQNIQIPKLRPDIGYLIMPSGPISAPI